MPLEMALGPKFFATVVAGWLWKPRIAPKVGMHSTGRKAPKRGRECNKKIFPKGKRKQSNVKMLC